MLEYNFDIGKDEESYYIPIKNSNTFISKVITELKVCESFQQLNADENLQLKVCESFQQMTIYGSNEFPLFTLKSVRDMLDIPRKTLEDQIRNYRSHQVIRGCKVKIQKKYKEGDVFLTKINSMILLTKHGLYRAMFISDTPIAHAFQDFVSIILVKLEKNGEVKLQEAIDATRQQLHKVEDERDKLLEKTLSQSYHLTRYQNLDDCLTDRETFAMSGNLDYKNLCAFKEVCCTKIPIYIVREKYMRDKYTKNKKKNKEEKDIDSLEADFEIKHGGGYSKIFNDYDICDLENDELYYFIPIHKSKAVKNPGDYHLVAHIYVYDGEHHKAILERFNNDESSKTLARGIYRTYYSSILDVVKVTLNDRLYKIQKDKQAAA